MFYLDLSSPCQVSECSQCKKKQWKENSSNLEGEIEDLKEFQNLRGINASNNNFTRLEGLFTILNKDKVEKINLFGSKMGTLTTKGDKVNMKKCKIMVNV